MKALVTSKGQVTIPKALRDQFGIEPGVQVDFIVASDGLHLRKVVDRERRKGVLGCLKEELDGRTVGDLLDELRGRSNCRLRAPGASAHERGSGRHIGPPGDLQR